MTPLGVVFAATSITCKRMVNENGKWSAQCCKKKGAGLEDLHRECLFLGVFAPSTALNA